jgi:F-type H+-transporting ATPase subunit gamma
VSVDLEALGARRDAISALVPLLEGIRSIAELAYRRNARLVPPVDQYTDHVQVLLSQLVASLPDEARAGYLAGPGGDPMGLLVITSERGLCGAFNERLVARSLEVVQQEIQQGTEVKLLCWGSRGKRLLEAKGQTIHYSARLPSFTLATYLDVEQLALDLLNLMDRLGIGRLTVLYSAPTRGFQYEIALRQLLPPHVQATPGPRPRVEVKPAGDLPELLTHLLTEHVLVGLYRAAVESAISEQLARIATLRMAVENARQLVDELTRQYDVARQHAITQSLLEIVAGYEATGTVSGPTPTHPRHPRA